MDNPGFSWAVLQLPLCLPISQPLVSRVGIWCPWLCLLAGGSRLHPCRRQIPGFVTTYVLPCDDAWESGVMRLTGTFLSVWDRGSSALTLLLKFMFNTEQSMCCARRTPLPVCVCTHACMCLCMRVWMCVLFLGYPLVCLLSWPELTLSRLADWVLGGELRSEHFSWLHLYLVSVLLCAPVWP